MEIAPQPESSVVASPLGVGDRLPEEAFQEVLRRMVLDACKWDPQVGDVTTISPFPLLLGRSHWVRLSDLAARLAAELMAAERELLVRPELHGDLGLPGGIRSVLSQAPKLGTTPAAARVLRFDFHWTDEGWRISEVNSDVPGGFSEASELPALMASHFPETRPAGNPGAALADAIAAGILAGQSVALLAATGFMEDQQVIAYLTQLLCRRGVPTIWTLPENLCWREGHAYQVSRLDRGPMGAIIRFFQAEWLNARTCPEFFIGGRTPVCNPGTAVLTESKRFPLVWDRLATALPTWRSLLPRTVDPRDVDWRKDDRWLLKSAFCNTGDTVAIRELLSDASWRSAARAVGKSPGTWVAQRRFTTCPLQTPLGPIYPCLGVYTVNGDPAGIYGRFSHRPVIDFAAVDVAVLITDDQDTP